MTLAPTQAWQDAFGTVLAQFDGGNRRLLLIAPAAIAQASLEALQNLNLRKQTLVLALLEELHTAPIAHVIRSVEPKALIALLPDLMGIASRGPAAPIETQSRVASTGLEYQIDGCPAWHSSAARAGDLEQASVAASTATSFGLPCLACGTDWLETALKRLA